ncbi:MAG: biotin transporter BioY [Candidatus Kapabacteria bacterium]|nr:biotin transporter BioY [Candidatus Kapabacteria bacterium]
MNNTQPTTLDLRRIADSQTVLLSLSGIVAIMLCTQVRVPLPFTPVPITGQTFAVIAWPLLFGYRAGLGAVGGYLALGALGAPVFAGFESLTALWGPTSGYLVGFALAAALTGRLRDAGATSSAAGLFLTIISAQALILVCGAAVLSLFVGTDNSLMMGVAPFLAGDAIKTALLFTMTRLSRWNATN